MSAQDYQAGTDFFFECVAQVTEANLDNHHPEGWSARQVIHHMADSEVTSYVRLRRLIAEPEGSTIEGYDEAAWAANPVLGYQELPIETSLAAILAVRTASATLLHRITKSDLNRFGIHSESGHYTLAKWLEIYTSHPREHGDQLLRALQSQS